MAYLTIARIAGEPEQLLDGYRETAGVMSGVGRDHGLIAHAAAKTGDGMLIVNLWPSKDRSEAAAADPRRRDVIRHHALEASRFHYEHHEVADYELFTAGGAEQLQVGTIRNESDAAATAFVVHAPRPVTSPAEAPHAVGR